MMMMVMIFPSSMGGSTAPGRQRAPVLTCWTNQPCSQESDLVLWHHWHRVGGPGMDALPTVVTRCALCLVAPAGLSEERFHNSFYILGGARMLLFRGGYITLNIFSIHLFDG